MPEQDLHPSVEDLVAFSAGQLSSPQAKTVETHIGQCSPCCETLLELSADDTFVELLKEIRDLDFSATVDTANPVKTASTELAGLALAEHPRYEIVERIAKGGMGEVFKATHRMMDRDVALKVINNDLMRNSEVVQRFHREVKTAAHLSHPNIVTAYDAEEVEGVHFLVMEHVDGVNLADLVKQDGSLSITKACEYARQAAIGLQHAFEQGMVHRDMKPHNLMLTTNGTIKILDFGLASLGSKPVSLGATELPEHASLTVAGALMGTPNFISPEQAVDARQADIRSDIYSLGATLHYLLSGQPPFAEDSVAETLKSHAEAEPTSITSLRDDAPPELSDVISRMMAKDPDQRFQTPEDVAEALAPFAAAGPAHSTAGRMPWWPPTKLTTVVCALFGLILASIIYLETDQGTLVIDSVDERVKVTISKADDEEGDSYLKMNIVDTVTGSQVKRLPSGDYKVFLGKDGNQFELSQGGFTLTRGDDVVVRVTRKTKAKTEPDTDSVPPMNLPRIAQDAFFMQGSRLSLEAAKELQSRADADPSDLESRLQLLAFYSRKSLRSPEMRQPHRKLVIWLVKNYPESYAAGSHAAHFHASVDPDGYVEAKKLWLEHTKAQSQNVAILRNAAKYFLQSDRQTAEELLNKARVLKPDDADLAHQLGHLYQLGLSRMADNQRQERAMKSMEQYEAAVNQDPRTPKNHHWLGDLARVAFEAGALEKSRQYAQQLLKTSSDGKAIHVGNIVLGRLALLAGDLEKSKRHLLAAGKTKGSPSLNSFGPNMALAKELLEQGEQESVLEYFQLCGKFWKKKEKLKEWTDIVQRGGIPNFGGNLSY